MSEKIIADEAAPPDIIRRIIEGFQYETSVIVPGANGEDYKVQLGTLWDDEIRQLQREIGARINPSDFITRDLESRFEVVVRATISITSPDGYAVWQVLSSNEEATRYRRQKLRELYGRLPRTVVYLYEKYRELERRRDTEFDAGIERIKKSSQMPDVPDKMMENLPESSSSGEVGGDY